MMTKAAALSWLPEVENHGAATKNVAAARNNDGATKNTRGNEPGTTRGRATAGPQKLGAPPRPRPTRGHEALSLARAISGFEQQNSFRNTENSKESFQSGRRLSAKRAPGRNRARDHPLQRRTHDHWATSPAAGPRRARASAAAKRARPRKRASLARCKKCDFGPELGFEQRNRFRSLRDTRRTKKKVLRKPPAGAPVVGQTFKYIY